MTAELPAVGVGVGGVEGQPPLPGEVAAPGLWGQVGDGGGGDHLGAERGEQLRQERAGQGGERRDILEQKEIGADVEETEEDRRIVVDWGGQEEVL